MNFAKTSIAVSVIMTLGYLVSFLKEAVIANYFGVSADVDAFTIAIQIPVTLFALVSVAVRSVVIPIYSELLHKEGKANGAHFLDNIISVVGLIAIAMIVVCEIFAGGIIYLFAPGFDASTHQLSTTLLRLTLPTMLFTVVGQIFIALLNVHKKFIWPAFSVYILSGTVIVFTILLQHYMGVAAACLGQVVGSFLYMLFLFIVGRHIYHFRFRYEPRDEQVKRSLKMSLPVIWSISVAEVNTIVNRAVASFLFAGSIAALGYASKINAVFMSLFVSAISTIVYPLYAESSAKDDMKGLNTRVNTTLSAYTLLLLPLMCILFCFRTELVEVAFARGRFDAAAVQQTQVLFGCYTIGLLFSAFRETITKVFYSLKDTKTPAKNATIGVVLNIVLNLTLPWFMGVKGLAIATSLSAMYISISLLYLLVKRFDVMHLSVFYGNLRGIVLASCILVGSIYVFFYFCDELPTILKLIVGALLSICVYAGSVFALRVPIGKTLLKMLLKKG